MVDNKEQIYMGEPPQHSKKHRGLKAIIIILAFVIVGSGVTLTLILNNPVTLVGKAIINTVDEINDIQPLTVLREANRTGSLTIQIETNELIGNDGLIELGFYNNLDKLAEALSIRVETQGKNIEALVSSDEASIALKCDALLDDCYGIDLQNAADNLPHSIWAPDSGSEVSMDKEVYEMVMNFIESRDDRETLRTRVTELVSKYTRRIIELLIENGVTDRQKQELKIGDRIVKTTMVTMTLNAREYNKRSQELLKEIQSDPEVKSVLIQAGNLMKLFKPGFGYESGEEYEEDVMDYLGELQDKFLIDESGGGCTTFSFYVTQDKTLVSCALTYSDGDTAENVISITLGEHLGTTDYLEFRMDKPAFVVRIDQNDSEAFKARTFISDDSEYEIFNVDYDKTSCRFKLNSEYMESETVAGTFCSSGENITITVDDFIVNEREYPISSTINIRTKDDVPGISEYKDILLLTEEDFGRIGEEIGKNIDILYELRMAVLMGTNYL